MGIFQELGTSLTKKGTKLKEKEQNSRKKVQNSKGLHAQEAAPDSSRVDPDPTFKINRIHIKKVKKVQSQEKRNKTQEKRYKNPGPRGDGGAAQSPLCCRPWTYLHIFQVLSYSDGLIRFEKLHQIEKYERHSFSSHPRNPYVLFVSELNLYTYKYI